MNMETSPADSTRYSAELELAELTNLMDGVIAADLGGRITYWNQMSERLFGWSANEVMGWKLDETIIPAQHILAHRAGMRAFAETGHGGILDRRVEISARCRDGREIPVELAVTVRRDANSVVNGFIAVLRDLSARMRAQESLHFRAQILDQIGESVVLTDLHGTIQTWNKAAQTLYGFSEIEATGQNIDILLPEDQRRAFTTSFVEPALARGVHQGEFVNHHKNGTEVDVDLTLSPLKDDDGEIIGLIHCSSDISARKKTEKLLRESESLYRSIVSTAQEGIWVLDPEARTSYVNRRMCELLGYESEEFAGALLFDFMDESGRRDAEQNLRRRREGISESHEFRFKHKDGSDVWTLIATNPLQDDEGNYVGTLGMISDIGERKAREEERNLNNETLRRKNRELEAARRKYKDLYDNAPCGYHSLDKHGFVVEMNQTELNWLGYQWEEVEGKIRGIDFITEQSKEKFASVFPELMTNGYVRDVEYDFIRKDGGIMPVSLSALVVRDEIGNFLRANASVVDVTERQKVQELLAARQAEIELLNANLKERVQDVLRKNRDLEAFNRNYEDLYHNAPCGYHTLDKDGLLIEMNKTELAWLGYEWDELKGKVRTFDLLTEDSKKKFETVFPNIINNGYIQDEEFEFIRRDGTTLPVSVSAVAIMDENGKLARARASVVDVTERKKVQELLAARQAEIEELNANLEVRVRDELRKNREKDLLLIQQSRFASLGEMIGNIAHQWRQPLNAINLLLINIKDAFDYDELDESFLDESLSKGGVLVRGMSDTIDDFRNFFKPNKARTVFAVQQTVRDALAIVESEFKYRNIKTEIVESSVQTEGFPNEYSQVILNLLKNARDAIVEKESTAGWIRIEVRERDGKAEMCVSDNGGGIPDNVMERIFDPYFTTKDAGKGTGIGLYMSKMIVEDHMHGRILVSRIEGGTEVRVITEAC